MNNIKYFIFNVLFFFSFNVITGQSYKKNTISFYKKLNEIKASDIKSGKYLEVARELPVDKFVQYYLNAGKKIQSKKYGDYILFQELYKDSLFTYFGRTYTYGLIDFIKVSNKELPILSFILLDGQELRKLFIDQVISQEDKSLVNVKDKNCISTSSSQYFEYLYIKDLSEVEIRCYWKIKCDFLNTIINKEYVARYNIDKKKFVM